MDRKIGRQWDRVLGGGKYFIVQNEVLKTLSELMMRFSDDFSGDKFFREDRTPRTNRRLAKQYKTENKRLFVGSSGDLEYGEPSPMLFGADLSKLVDSLNDPKGQWRVKAFKGEHFRSFHIHNIQK